MKKSYYQPEDLKNFGKIKEWNEALGTKFFDYYNSVFEEGSLSAREKSLIALAVSHVIHVRIVSTLTPKMVYKEELTKKR